MTDPDHRNEEDDDAPDVDYEGKEKGEDDAVDAPPPPPSSGGLVDAAVVAAGN